MMLKEPHHTTESAKHSALNKLTVCTNAGARHMVVLSALPALYGLAF
jgi:hypothetical protein